ncbi:SusE domain-containing protein [Sphingobacterium paludis]|uniref:SusE-like outer membrane protein n=1 Tax=Sphingobacterium paludis TaxID=1476465 RepID=A0A4R7D2Z9_9SPHI|nr:SusE domain-containing protein [Sphingobacterium paludis]TDS13196.1 SusE-like outer membrane protein [Sphingobacterium paludis]
MKRISIFIWLSALLACFEACKTDDMNYTDVEVTPVTALFEPLDNKAVKLVSSSTASLFFEWEAALSEDGGAALYEVVFDKVGGDFSKPLYKLMSNNNGFGNNAYVTHKVLNAVAVSSGVNPGESGEVQWTVIASRGIKRVQSSVVRKLNISSLEGFADIPDALYVSGEGSEGGTAVATALPFKQTAPGEFEIYTRLEAGKSYVFLDRKDANARKFYTDDQVKLREAAEETNMQVSQTGVYRVVLDFNVATVSFTEIRSIGLWFSPENKILFNLPYQGKGVWSGTGVVTFRQESWGRDERYKFQLTTVSNGNNVIQQFGAKNSTDSRPTAASDPSYYHLKLLNTVTQWDDKWKFDGAVDGKSTTITVVLQGDKEYTHSIKVN